MPSTKIALAQILLKESNVCFNISQHLKMIVEAAKHDVRYLIFPELSLTGYMTSLAAYYTIDPKAFLAQENELSDLREAAKQYNMDIVVGAPVPTDAPESTNRLPAIGAITLQSNGEISIYRKMHLHAGEEAYYRAGKHYKQHHLQVGVDSIAIGQGICADTLCPEHIEYYSRHHSAAYLSGVSISQNGYISDSQKMHKYSSQYTMLVGVANNLGESNGLTGVGKSAFWYEGQTLACADDKTDSLVVATREDAKKPIWHGEVIPVHATWCGEYRTQEQDR